ncbi:hypothetical protein C2E23DRAFT_346931 [Lenzites betulinus]|nr:hypothetical protein C2E23DRAFT_346931 [Lenzites betulinus]
MFSRPAKSLIPIQRPWRNLPARCLTSSYAAGCSFSTALVSERSPAWWRFPLLLSNARLVRGSSPPRLSSTCETSHSLSSAIATRTSVSPCLLILVLDVWDGVGWRANALLLQDSFPRTRPSRCVSPALFCVSRGQRLVWTSREPRGLRYRITAVWSRRGPCQAGPVHANHHSQTSPIRWKYCAKPLASHGSNLPRKIDVFSSSRRGTSPSRKHTSTARGALPFQPLLGPEPHYALLAITLAAGFRSPEPHGAAKQKTPVLCSS